MSNPSNSNARENNSLMSKQAITCPCSDQESFDGLWNYCCANDRVVPKDWNKLYKKLGNRRRLASGGWEPPLPLILAAWYETSPMDKQLRFKEHIDWASHEGQTEEIGKYLRSLAEDDWYHFAEL
jgi:hypothetical protein